MRRREFLPMMAGLGIALATAACTNGGGLAVDAAVDVKIPPELTTLIDDANSIYAKLSSISLPAGAAGLLGKLKSAVSSIASSKTLADAKNYMTDFSSIVSQIQPFLPSTGTVGQIVTAIDTVLPIMLKVVGLVAMFAAARPTGMPLAQARAILHS